MLAKLVVVEHSRTTGVTDLSTRSGMQFFVLKPSIATLIQPPTYALGVELPLNVMWPQVEDRDQISPDMTAMIGLHPTLGV